MCFSNQIISGLEKKNVNNIVTSLNIKFKNDILGGILYFMPKQSIRVTQYILFIYHYYLYNFTKSNIYKWLIVIHIYMIYVRKCASVYQKHFFFLN